MEKRDLSRRRRRKKEYFLERGSRQIS